MGSRAGMACTRMHTKDKGVGKGDGPNHHREGSRPVACLASMPSKHTLKGGVPALHHRLRHTPKGGVPACTPPAAQDSSRPAGHSGSHLRRQGLPTSGGTPIAHARAGGHGLLLSACSSPGWRQMCHFNVTCVFKLPSYFLAAPSRPTLPPALGLLKASRFSSVLAVNRR